MLPSASDELKWRLFFVVLCLASLLGDSWGHNEDVSGRNQHPRTCRHAHPTVDEVVLGVKLEQEHDHVIRRRSLDQPLRIVLYYDHSVYRLDAEKFELINSTILPEAVQFLERSLSVRKTADVIRLNRKCTSRQVFVKGGRTHCIGECREVTTCGEVTVPDEHLNACWSCSAAGLSCGERGVRGPGVPSADFVLYVSAVQTERCSRGLTVAYAAHCQQESVTDRPIAGHANFCPNELSTRPQELGSMLSTVQHEMLHALGFSVSLYAFYRDEEGNPLTERNPDTGSPPLNEELQIHQWSERVVRNITRERWMVRTGYISRNIQVMVTPRVVREVRDHFGCSSLEGAELEDQGGEGTALTHWEKRIMENEAMTGTHTQNPVFSRVTLALMEDTGWYRADYSLAQPLVWGRGLGCRFLTTSCMEWINTAAIKNRSAHPFCSRVKRDPLQTECSQQRDSVALCNLVMHEHALPLLYQHFETLPDAVPGTEDHYGGSVSLADYCPYTQEFTWRYKNVVVRGSRCSFPENNPKPDKNFALESYGENSKCFDHTNRMWEQRSCRQVRQWQHWGSGCYEYKCEGGRLHIMVGNYSYECYHAGQEISVRIVRGGWLHRGAIVCPPCRELCQENSCLGGEESPPLTAYPRDDLQCLSAGPALRPGPAARALPLLAVAVSLGALLSATSLCLCSRKCSTTLKALRNNTHAHRERMKMAELKKKAAKKFTLEQVVIVNEEIEHPVHPSITAEPPSTNTEAKNKQLTVTPTVKQLAVKEQPVDHQKQRKSMFEDAIRSVLEQSLDKPSDLKPIKPPPDEAEEGEDYVLHRGRSFMCDDRRRASKDVRIRRSMRNSSTKTKTEDLDTNPIGTISSYKNDPNLTELSLPDASVASSSNIKNYRKSISGTEGKSQTKIKISDEEKPTSLYFPLDEPIAEPLRVSWGHVEVEQADSSYYK